MKRKIKDKIRKSLKRYWREVHKIQRKAKIKASIARKVYRYRKIGDILKKQKEAINIKNKEIITEELKNLNIKVDSIIGQKMIEQGMKQIVREKVEQEISKKRRFRYLKHKVYDYKNKKYITRKQAEQIKKRMRRKIHIKNLMKKYDMTYSEAREFYDIQWAFFKYIGGSP